MVWTQEYQLFVLCDCPGEGSLQKDCCWHLTLKMTTAQGIETSVTNNILASWRLPSPRNLGAGYLTFLLFPLFFFHFFIFFVFVFAITFSSFWLHASLIPTPFLSLSSFPFPFFFVGPLQAVPLIPNTFSSFHFLFSPFLEGVLTPKCAFSLPVLSLFPISCKSCDF